MRAAMRFGSPKSWRPRKRSRCRAAPEDQPVPDTVDSGMPDAGPEDPPATEEILIGSDVIQDAPSEPVHETAPLLDEGDEPSAA